MTAIKIVVTSQYGRLSRGRHSARRRIDGGVVWADKDTSGRLVITTPGQWQLHCADGFKREARAVLTVSDNGDWEITGDTGRFDVAE